MPRILQFQAVQDVNANTVNIFALTDDGRLLIRPTPMEQFEINKWGEVFFPPKKEVKISAGGSGAKSASGANA